MKYQLLRDKIKEPIFSRQDLRLLGLGVFGYQLSLWQKKGYLIKLKNGVYAFVDRLPEIKLEQVSGKLYAPSYVSLERALSIYGIIPEIVYSITSVTPKATRRFKNKLGNFIYRHLKPPLFFGYKPMSGYLLADPEKAVLDHLYLNAKSKEDMDNLRFKRHIIKKVISKNKFLKYLKKFNNIRLNRLAENIAREL